jgi:hypothetical protein
MSILFLQLMHEISAVRPTQSPGVDLPSLPVVPRPGPQRPINGEGPARIGVKLDNGG